VKIKRTLPRDTPYDVRAFALAKRLGLIKRLGLDSPEQLSAWQWEERLGLWALIGIKLAKKEPEFGRAPGRPPGSKNKKQKPYDELDLESQIKRRYREKQPDKRSIELSDLIRWEEKSDKN
jgi:hypothetical protein